MYTVPDVLKPGMIEGFAEELQLFTTIRFSVLSLQRD
jgi:hypothetical protein